MPPSHHPSPTILLPQLPPKTLVGIDLVAFTSTANFHGIRDLPPGWHFLYTGTTESFSLRCGSWFHVGDVSHAGKGDNETALVRAHAQPPQQPLGADIYIWKWSTESESLSCLLGESDSDRQEAMRYKANLGSLWQSGGLFRYRSRVSPAMLLNKPGSAPLEARLAEEDEEVEEEGRRDWRQLTNRLSPEVLSRIVGSPEQDVDGHLRWTVTSASTANRDADHIPGVDSPSTEEKGDDKTGVRKTIEREKEFNFLPVDLKRTWREGAIGRERTEGARDKTWALSDLVLRNSSRVGGEITVDESTGEAQILGELQFTFLMVLTMMNFSCLQQWKRLLELVLTSRQAIVERKSLVSEVIRILLKQLQRCDDVEGGLFEMDGDEGGHFIHDILKKLRRSVDEVAPQGSNSTVRTELGKLEGWVKEEYDWELNRESVVRRGMLQLEDGEEVEMEMEDNDADEETGEYAPMVVDLGEHHTPVEEDGDETSDLDDVRY
ncbi:Uncharacterized protein PECH_005147 [Penicillium ucsense]|uniref:A1 cistron-splicing factor n=1 Tax=Penicillium ucsense TaxID=2839758 RepID=A0A8J8W2Q3_9EURO|nr:Uncharacterized protein PECM_005876 [Penicillium ucsense]KAF7736637.1 Uncharacterized protein PECH_005147 [Penicillium ucsense]